MRLGFNMASTLAIIETEPVNAAGRQSSQPRQALLPSEYNAYWAAKSQLPGSGAMKTMVTGNALSKAKASCTMQHVARSTRAAALCMAVSLEACQSWLPVSPGR